MRMYRVGFGDCFLITFRDGQSRHILVDCGVHSRGDIGKLGDVVQDVAQETKGKIALLIATHAHEDHISGFGRFGDLFRQMTVADVWLPWCENPADRVAARLKEKTRRLYAALVRQFAASPPSAEAAAALASLTAATNADALKGLRDGFGSGKDPQYLAAGRTVSDAAGIEGLSAQILGPPRDEEFLKQMDPPKDQRFLRLGARGGEAALAAALRPFPDLAGHHDGRGPRLDAEEEESLREQAAGSPDALAFALSEAMNNTSLVVLFSYRGKRLLFPGDAQYGNWRAWMEDASGPAILSSLDFYKVSHHGSANATPKGALEGMTGGHLAAMVSTQKTPWPSIPAAKLMKALETTTGGRVARSEWVPVPGASQVAPPDPLPAGFACGPLWVDWTTKV